MPKAYVIGSYIAAGGTYMAYSVGEIFHNFFGIEAFAVIVGDETPLTSPFRYERRATYITLSDFKNTVRPDDFVICNPSFSHYGFGLCINARKIMYVQGFTTFEKIDAFFDHYVSVSVHVKNYINNLYSIRSDVIPAYINTESINSTTEWSNKKENTILISQKVKSELDLILACRITDGIQVFFPKLQFEYIKHETHHDILNLLNSNRYLLALNVAEGFGLIPLEAMALGNVVIGWNGFGGTEFMRTGHNCLTVPYPELANLIKCACDVIGSQQVSIELSRNARSTAELYSKDVFTSKWVSYISSII